MAKNKDVWWGEVYKMKYYSAKKKKNTILPFAATWMYLGIVILREISQDKYDTAYMWNLKKK